MLFCSRRNLFIGNPPKADKANTRSFSVSLSKLSVQILEAKQFQINSLSFFLFIINIHKNLQKQKFQYVWFSNNAENSYLPLNA